MTHPRLHGSLFVSCFTAAVLLAAPSTGRAQEAAPTATGSSGGSSAGSSGFAAAAGSFGEARQWVFSMSSEGEFPFRLSKTGDGEWGMVFRPSLDVFLIRNVSVGGIVTLSKYGGGSDVGFGARAGYNVGLTSLVSIWIRGGIYVHRYATDNAPSGTETVMDLNVPFLFHVVPHFFLGVGPFFHLPLQNSMMGGTDATYGLTATVGGWL